MYERYEIVLKSSSILIAEDEDKVRESFEKVLSLYFDTVYSAKDGLEAYEIYLEHHPDIIITDVKMPKLNGLELIKNIRKENQNIPIVVTSAYADQDLLLESIKLSLVEYVIKPMKAEDLTRVLQECAKVLINKSKTIVKLTDDTFYDYNNKTFVYRDETVILTQKEVEFFELLLAHRGNLITKQAIEDKLYIYEEAPPSALKNLVFKLRKKLPLDIIKSQGKLGYIIE